MEEEEEERKNFLEGYESDTEDEEDLFQQVGKIQDSNSNGIGLSLDEEKKVERWQNKLIPLVPSHFSSIVEKTIEDITRRRKTILENKEQVKNLYQFLCSRNKVKLINEDWPPNVFPGNCCANGYGFKAKGSPDDIAYRKDPTLQDKLPRGIVFVKETTKNTLDLVLFSHRKFYGRTIGDEDDSDIVTLSLDEANYTKFMVTSKINGEIFQVSVWSTPSNEKMFIMGSKNRKLAVSSEKDLGYFEKDQSYSYAVEMARFFFRHLSKTEENKVDELKEFLALTGLTINFEFESPSHQHVVPLFTERLVMISCTGFHLSGKQGVHPALTLAVSKYFQFPSVVQDCQVYSRNQIEEVCNKIVRGWESEGSVLVLLNSLNETVDLVKVKTWWYVILRAIREKVRRLDEVTTTSSRISERIRRLKKDMKMDSLTVDTFERINSHFVKWMKRGARKNKVANEYPLLWLSFLQEMKWPQDKSLLNFPIK